MRKTLPRSHVVHLLTLLQDGQVQRQQTLEEILKNDANLAEEVQEQEREQA